VGEPAIPPQVETLLAKLTKVKGGHGRWTACCPVHEADGRSIPSLSIGIGGDGKLLLNCHGPEQCTAEAIVAAVGMSMTDLFPSNGRSHGPARAGGPALRVVRDDVGPVVRPHRVASWQYVDETGAPLFSTHRMEYPLEPGQTKPKKTFRQSHPDPSDPNKQIWNLDGVRRVLYRLPELLGAVEDGKRIFLTEGEKHADALWALGYPATTAPMGAGHWQEDYGVYLEGADVVILPDNDETGRSHAEQVAASLTARSRTVRVLPLPDLPEKGDIIDWLAAGGTPEALERLAAEAPVWTRDELDARAAARKTRFTLRELLANEEIMRPPMAVVPRIVWGGRLTLLAGLYKIGKSTLTGCLAKCVSLGLPFLDVETCREGDVLLVGLEEWIGDPARRLHQFGAHPDRVTIVDRLFADPKNRLAELKDHIDAVKPLLVIVDSLIKFGSGLIQNENDAAQMEAVVGPLADLTHDYPDMGVLLTMHARRSDGRARGSGAIMGAADVICELTQPQETALTRPMLRRMLSVGRVPIPPSYDFVYDGRHYAVDGSGQALGEAPVASIESKIIAFVREHPGCSGRAVRDGVTGRDDEINNAVTRLLGSHALTDQGNVHARKLYVPGDLEVEVEFDFPGVAS
jgi:putative DNA primase/helicase